MIRDSRLVQTTKRTKATKLNQLFVAFVVERREMTNHESSVLGHHLILENSVGVTNVDSGLITSGPLTSDAARNAFHSGSLRKLSQDFFAASRLSCSRT